MKKITNNKVLLTVDGSAELAAEPKCEKYADIFSNYLFRQIAASQLNGCRMFI